MHETINVFLKTPSTMEWLLNPENKGKHERNVFDIERQLSFALDVQLNPTHMSIDLRDENYKGYQNSERMNSVLS